MINYKKFNQKKLRQKYCNNKFRHIVIDDFIKEEIANLLYENFPSIDDYDWWEYNNVFEKKYAMNMIQINIQNLKNGVMNIFIFLIEMSQEG